MSGDDLLLTGPTSTGVDPRVSALLCYLAWWVSAIVFLVIERQHHAVRFHAAQSLIVFGGLSVVMALLSMVSVGMLMVSTSAFAVARTMVYAVWGGAILLWIWLVYCTYQGRSWRVPFAGHLAAKIAAR